MSDPMLQPCLFAVSTSTTPCGVEDFTRQLVVELQQNEPDSAYEQLPVSGQWGELPSILRKMSKGDRVAFSVPMVAWKKTVVLPWILLLFAFFKRQTIFVFLHEWGALHPLRRLVLMPFIVLCDTIIVLSPFVKNQFASDRWLGWASKKCRFSINAPSIRRPEGRRVTENVRRVEQLRGNDAVVIGHFGSIYKGKGTDSLLDICAHLCGLGINASLVCIGGITKSVDGYENDFRDKVKKLGLESRVIVTGYVDDYEELFAIFDHIGAFLYIFPEGLTSRRGSVLGTLQSGRPVVVSEPTVANEFAHHAPYTSLIKSGALVFFPPSATTKDIANLIVAAAKQPTRNSAIDYNTAWKATTQATAAILNSRPAQGT